MNERIIHIYTEASPNPNSLKFVLNFDLIDISLDFPTIKDTKNCPLAKELFESFDFIQRVFIANNFITVTKEEETDWFEVMPNVKDFIKKYIQAERVIFTDDIKKQVVGADLKEQKINEGNDKETIDKIKVVLDEYVKPAVESDGGAISFLSYDNGKVTVLLQGSCSGCPSATVTLKNGVENLLKKMVPEVTEVVAEGIGA